MYQFRKRNYVDAAGCLIVAKVVEKKRTFRNLNCEKSYLFQVSICLVRLDYCGSEENDEK